MPQHAARPIPFREPMECRHADTLPEGADWQYEIKLDGYRVQAVKNNRAVRLFSRNGKAFEDRFPEIAEAVRMLRADEFAIDGELVALDAEGRHSFASLQKIGKHRPTLRLYAFDLLTLDGKDLTKIPLSRRRQMLQAKVPMPAGSLIQPGPVFVGDPTHILAKVREFGFEGVVAKRLDSVYRPGEEPGTWLKHKTQQSAEFVVGGMTTNGKAVDELLVGKLDGKRLVFVEAVRAGFVPATRRKVFAAMASLVARECPFSNLPERKGPGRIDRAKMAGVTWLKPLALAEIAFNEQTSAGHLRHAKFLRLREGGDIRKR